MRLIRDLILISIMLTLSLSADVNTTDLKHTHVLSGPTVTDSSGKVTSALSTEATGETESLWTSVLNAGSNAVDLVVGVGKDAGNAVLGASKSVTDTVTNSASLDADKLVSGSFIDNYNIGLNAAIMNNETGYGIYMDRKWNGFKLSFSYLLFMDQKFNSDGSLASGKSSRGYDEGDSCYCPPVVNAPVVTQEVAATPVVKKASKSASKSVSSGYTDDLDVFQLVAYYPVYTAFDLVKISALAGIGGSWNDTADEFGSHIPVGIEFSTFKKDDLEIALSYRKNIELDNRYVDEDMIALKFGWIF